MSNILNKTLKITCKSDFICGSGEGWGNVIDTDVVHDSYGFPYIPARRIKGLFREAAWEMQQFGLLTEQDIVKVFGNESTNHHFVLYNAYLHNIGELQKEVSSNSINEETVLEHYTITRYQTAVGEDGVALNNSLRSTHAIRKGTEFYCAMECCEEDFDIIQKASKLVTHAGISRTRGFGEIQIDILDGPAEKKKAYNLNLEAEKEYKVTLHMKNKSPLYIPSAGKSFDYIPGASLQGFFIQHYLKSHKTDDEFYDLLKNVRFINAYISDEIFNVYYPVHESLYKQKIVGDYYDKIMVDTPKDGIFKKVNGKYILQTQDIHKVNIKEVDTEVSYHHRRPDDKSIGHALDNERRGSGLFYQVDVISADQYFVGEFIGKGKYIQSLIQDLPAFIKIGGSKNVEYGNVHILDLKVKEWSPEILKKGEEVICTLVEPAVLLNEYRESDLRKESLWDACNIEGNASFIGYTEIGGYNAKWRLQKPSYHAFSQGTCVKGTLKEDTPSELFIGDFTNEGNGFVNIIPCSKAISTKFQNNTESSEKKKIRIQYAKDIYVDKLKKENYAKCLNAVLKSNKGKSLNMTSIGRVSKMADKPTLALFEKDVNGIKDDDKRKEILAVYDDVKRITENIVKESDITAYVDKESYRNELVLKVVKDYFVKLKLEGRDKE